MRRFSLFLFLAFLAIPAIGAEVNSTDEKAVLAAEKAWADAAVAADVNTLDRLFSDDLVYTHSSGKQQTKAQVIDDIKNKRVNLDYDNETTSLRQYGNVMLVAHKRGGTFYTMVWVRQPGGWRLVSRQATRLAPK